MGEKKGDLIRIVGAENVMDAPEILETYSRDQSFARPMKPRLVVKPKDSDEVQGIVKWANQTGTPLVPVSSGLPRFRGDTVPSMPGAVIVDLSRMKRIIRIDRRNRMAIVEPGVTYSQLEPELAKEDLRLSMPLVPRISKSVLASLLEREPTLVPKYQWQMPDPLRSTEVVWGNGEILKTGDAGTYGQLEEQWKEHLAQVSGLGPLQADYYRFVLAAQGTMGIVTWGAFRCEIKPKIHKILFVPAERLDDLLGFAYRLLRYRYADEFLFLNNLNLASIIGEGPERIMTLKEELPQWVLILGLAGRDRLPMEMVEFQEKDITDIAQQFGLKLASTIPGAGDRMVLEALVTPSKEPYWKLRYKGGCQDIFFLTTLDKTPQFVNTVYALSQTLGYSPSEIGTYIQPMIQGVACHCEFNLPYDPSNQKELTKIQRLFTEGSKALMKHGAFFSRPYDMWADMVYNGDAQTTIALKKVKGIFDPNNVMNPGKLCF
jgi:FAD/FMN-containing dehydrogenase